MGTVGARGQVGSSAINSELPRLLVEPPQPWGLGFLLFFKDGAVISSRMYLGVSMGEYIKNQSVRRRQIQVW